MDELKVGCQCADYCPLLSDTICSYQIIQYLKKMYRIMFVCFFSGCHAHYDRALDVMHGVHSALWMCMYGKSLY